MNQIKDIEQLIPHRDPFLFLDEITEVNENSVKGNRTFERAEQSMSARYDGLNFIPGTILLESMVQCGGAGVKKMGLAEGLFGLAHIEKADFYERVLFGEKVNYEINNFKISKKYIKQSGKAFFNGKLIMEAIWMCVRLD